MKIYSAELVTSAPDLLHAPLNDSLPEVALMGRSNVGKSSFLNSLLNQKHVARVSQTPGKTRLLNYFRIDRAWYLVDMPGYGYAKVSKTEQQRWGKAMAEFLQQRQALGLAVVLLDIRHGPQTADLEVLGWLDQLHLPRLLVLNKADKLSRSQMLQSVKKISQMLPDDRLFPYSAHTHAGREEFLKALKLHLNLSGAGA